MSHVPLEIILMIVFAAEEAFLLINVENSCEVYVVCGNHDKINK